jgi:hypothetical protein
MHAWLAQIFSFVLKMLLTSLQCVQLAAALLGIGLPMPWRFVFAKLLLADVRMA